MCLNTFVSDGPPSLCQAEKEDGGGDSDNEYYNSYDNYIKLSGQYSYAGLNIHPMKKRRTNDIIVRNKFSKDKRKTK